MPLKDVGARLVVDGLSQFKSGMGGADKAVEGFGARVQKSSASLRKLGIGMVAFGGILTGVLAFTVKQASDAEEMMSKFRVVFRDQAREVEAWATTLAGAVNRSRYLCPDGVCQGRSCCVE